MQGRSISVLLAEDNVAALKLNMCQCVVQQNKYVCFDKMNEYLEE
jgi:hypothetical protein